MTAKQAVKILEKHNKWRRGDKRIKMQNHTEIGKAIDIAVKMLKYNIERDNLDRYQL